MAKLPGVYELMATAASPAINFGRGLMGFQNPFLTQTMQDRMTELESKKGSTGSIGYGDYGLPVLPGGRFAGGLFDLALSNPVDFGLAGSVGRYGFGPEGRTGLKYDFTPDQDTGSTGSTILDFINEGGVKGKLADLNIMGTAQAGEVTPKELQALEGPRSIQDAVAQVVAEGGSPSLIQDEARFDRIDKLLGIIPSEKPEETGTTGPTTSDYMVRNMLNQPTTEFLKERRSTPGTPSSKYLPQTINQSRGPLYVDPNLSYEDFPLTEFEKELRYTPKGQREEIYNEMLGKLEGMTDVEKKDYLHYSPTDANLSGIPYDFEKVRALEYTDDPVFEDYYETGEHWSPSIPGIQRFKQQQLMNKRKQNFQNIVRREEAAKQKAAADAAAAAPTSHAEARSTGGDYHSGHQSTVGGQTTDWGSESAMIARGGLAQHAPRYANGGLIDFFRYGGFI